MDFILKLFKTVVDIDCEMKMVILITTDLKMGQGKVATHCAHAAVALCDLASVSFKSNLKAWFKISQPKIVLRINEDCEKTMRLLYARVRANNLNTCLIVNTGRTQLEGGTLTALGLGPNRKKDIDELTKHFKLL